jgi:hypothetical protein
VLLRLQKQEREWQRDKEEANISRPTLSDVLVNDLKQSSSPEPNNCGVVEETLHPLLIEFIHKAASTSYEGVD